MPKPVLYMLHLTYFGAHRKYHLNQQAYYIVIKKKWDISYLFIVIIWKPHILTNNSRLIIFFLLKPNQWIIEDVFKSKPAIKGPNTSKNWNHCSIRQWGTQCSYIKCHRHWSLQLSHICLVYYSILVNWTSPFPNLGVSGVLFHFHFISNRNSC